MRPRWRQGPQEIVLVRHGHSQGNAADAAAQEAGAEVLDLHDRDADVQLSDTGREQAEGLAQHLARLEPAQRPTIAVSSPYRRAEETTRVALGGLGLAHDVDERLRERDLGILDGFTGAGIRSRFPDEAARRKKLGKFYYQPPQGESWADVVLRVRSLLNDLRVGHEGERVWLFTHQAVIMSFRFVLEDLSEAEILDLDREVQIPNASISRYRLEGDLFALEAFAEVGHVDDSDAAVTREPSDEEQHAS